MRFGYTLMTEQSGPRELVKQACAAERAGFDFAVMSDHYSPWLDAQGHSPYAWSVLGAVAQATERMDLMSFVTAPIMRYHPAVVAQKAATVDLLSDNRFTLGVGAGENLNEHVVGRGWPPVNVRHEMLGEALRIISALFEGGYVNFAGDHYRVDSATLWDLPEQRVPIATAVSGEQSIEECAPLADAMIAVQPEARLCQSWDSATGGGQRKYGQQPISWDPSAEAGAQRAWSKMRWFAGGWKVNAELPGTAAFAAATQHVRVEDVSAGIPCGPDVEPIVKSMSAYWEAGFTDIALVQVGVDENPNGFFGFARERLLPALREAAES
ncbi:TIGR03557 family F420-dependent LLM class oxidoreductase [Saccharopolyspora rhizosphaerae]|uniref:TIGR03557 family F420-dependent LLM class oxidoreductase n=1 Tax=Saccharopolyspora rhizosphaerae TaxID=2492662 RepID=UPI0018F3A4C4|nr:TIGR03557 family F420-dependent LLM class oxidoreductase [Saccharopolyspora rhizosphaerae]